MRNRCASNQNDALGKRHGRKVEKKIKQKNPVYPVKPRVLRVKDFDFSCVAQKKTAHKGRLKNPKRPKA
jgi:hypothetical protein